MRAWATAGLGMRGGPAYHADERVVLAGGQAQAGGNAADGRVGGGHIRVRAEVQVKHGGVGTLDEDALALVIGILDVLDGVEDEGPHHFCHYLVLGNVRLHVVLEGLAKPLLAIRCQLPQLVGKRGHVAEVTDTQAVAGGLAAVGWPNAALGGANRLARPCELRLPEAVNLLVQVEKEVCPVRDHEAAFYADPLLLQPFDLLEHARQVQHDAVADHALCRGVQDARRHQVQRELGASVIIDGVACIGSTLSRAWGQRGLAAIGGGCVHRVHTCGLGSSAKKAVATAPCTSAPVHAPRCHTAGLGCPPACPCPRRPTACQEPPCTERETAPELTLHVRRPLHAQLVASSGLEAGSGTLVCLWGMLVPGCPRMPAWRCTRPPVTEGLSSKGKTTCNVQVYVALSWRRY